MVLDNGAFHKAKKLSIPENIALIFLPLYCTELNPAEKMWPKYKRQLSNLLFDSLDKLEAFKFGLVVNTTIAEICSICRYYYVFTERFWTILYLSTGK